MIDRFIERIRSPWLRIRRQPVDDERLEGSKLAGSVKVLVSEEELIAPIDAPWDVEKGTLNP